MKNENPSKKARKKNLNLSEFIEKAKSVFDEVTKIFLVTSPEHTIAYYHVTEVMDFIEHQILRPELVLDFDEMFKEIENQRNDLINIIDYLNQQNPSALIKYNINGVNLNDDFEVEAVKRKESNAASNQPTQQSNKMDQEPYFKNHHQHNSAFAPKIIKAKDYNKISANSAGIKRKYSDLTEKSEETKETSQIESIANSNKIYKINTLEYVKKEVEKFKLKLKQEIKSTDSSLMEMLESKFNEIFARQIINKHSLEQTIVTSSQLPTLEDELKKIAKKMENAIDNFIPELLAEHHLYLQQNEGKHEQENDNLSTESRSLDTFSTDPEDISTIIINKALKSEARNQSPNIRFDEQEDEEMVEIANQDSVFDILENAFKNPRIKISYASKHKLQVNQEITLNGEEFLPSTTNIHKNQQNDKSKNSCSSSNHNSSSKQNQLALNIDHKETKNSKSEIIEQEKDAQSSTSPSLEHLELAEESNNILLKKYIFELTKENIKYNQETALHNTIDWLKIQNHSQNESLVTNHDDVTSNNINQDSLANIQNSDSLSWFEYIVEISKNIDLSEYISSSGINGISLAESAESSFVGIAHLNQEIFA